MKQVSSIHRDDSELRTIMTMAAAIVKVAAAIFNPRSHPPGSSFVKLQNFAV